MTMADEYVRWWKHHNRSHDWPSLMQELLPVHTQQVQCKEESRALFARSQHRHHHLRRPTLSPHRLRLPSHRRVAISTACLIGTADLSAGDAVASEPSRASCHPSRPSNRSTVRGANVDGDGENLAGSHGRRPAGWRRAIWNEKEMTKVIWYRNFKLAYGIHVYVLLQHITDSILIILHKSKAANPWWKMHEFRTFYSIYMKSYSLCVDSLMSQADHLFYLSMFVLISLLLFVATIFLAGSSEEIEAWKYIYSSTWLLFRLLDLLDAWQVLGVAIRALLLPSPNHL